MGDEKRASERRRGEPFSEVTERHFRLPRNGDTGHRLEGLERGLLELKAAWTELRASVRWAIGIGVTVALAVGGGALTTWSDTRDRLAKTEAAPKRVEVRATRALEEARRADRMAETAHAKAEEALRVQAGIKAELKAVGEDAGEAKEAAREAARAAQDLERAVSLNQAELLKALGRISRLP